MGITSSKQNDQNEDCLLIYSQLINMGFSEGISLVASQKHPNSIDQAILWISFQTNHQFPENNSIKTDSFDIDNKPIALTCNGCDIKNCSSLNRIQKVLKIYDEWLYNKENKDENFITYILSFFFF